MARKPTQQSLVNWTRQEWGYSNEKESKKPRAKRGRYLPKAAWAAMSKAERKKTDDKKKRESRKGKQFVENTKKARKARKMASKKAARSMK